ncbi:glycosyltransferase [Polynucleobacter sp. IMCC 30228]|uniref:glycosyltransferase n=1 Tax=Polynucleobacter sp. IMCC 30228 TaxID=2781011 RepID=UPI001F308336|nr:glycosyltransferase [Polynucleobacter sp. IMCC 30228]MCE7527816.1 glycosyltransferase [Polynucleobacter sp. IMCC 30228]
MKQSLKVLQVNTYDLGGGAEQIAINLTQAINQTEHSALLAVGEKRGENPAVIQIAKSERKTPWARFCLGLQQWLMPAHGKIRGIARMRQWLGDLAIGIDAIPRWLGMEEFHFPASVQLLELTQFSPDIVQMHNLHGGYFDLRALEDLSQQVPVVLTLHDAWLLSGNCAHSLGCARWQMGCGNCPDIHIYPGLSRDSTALNWQRKKRIYARSHLYIATPSQWLMNQVKDSILAPAIKEARVIPNGIDTQIFYPRTQADVRLELGLPNSQAIFLFTANGIRRNPFKDYKTLHLAIALLAKRTSQDILLLALGEEVPDEQIDSVRIRYLGKVSDPKIVAKYYQAADWYVHASKADTFPNSILEAMACATPVIATAVGGIPEQIIDGHTGYLVASGDSEALSKKMEYVLANPKIRDQLGVASVKRVTEHFTLELQAQRYIDWFREIYRKTT